MVWRLTSPSRTAPGRILDFGVCSLEDSIFNDEKRTGRDSPFLPHFACRIVPFQEFIVLLWADAESRYVGFNFNCNHMRGTRCEKYVRHGLSHLVSRYDG